MSSDRITMDQIMEWLREEEWEAGNYVEQSDRETETAIIDRIRELLAESSNVVTAESLGPDLYLNDHICHAAACGSVSKDHLIRTLAEERKRVLDQYMDLSMKLPASFLFQPDTRQKDELIVLDIKRHVESETDGIGRFIRERIEEIERAFRVI